MIIWLEVLGKARAAIDPLNAWAQLALPEYIRLVFPAFELSPDGKTVLERLLPYLCLLAKNLLIYY